MHSLFSKLTAAFLVIALVSVVIVGFSFARTSEQEFSTYLEQGPTSLRIAAAAHLLADYHRDHGSWTGVDSLVRTLAENGGGRLLLTDTEGTVIADSAGLLVGKQITRRAMSMSNPVMVGQETIGYIYFQFDQAAIGNGPISAMGKFMRRGMMGHRSLPTASLPTPSALEAASRTDAGGDAEILTLAVGPPERGFLRALSESLWLAALTAGGVAVALSVILAHQITSPLRRLTKAAQSMAQGRPPEKVEVSSRDEIGDLAEAFNAMAEQLQRNEQARRHMVADVAHELNTPLSVIRGNLEAMLDGVVPLDIEQIASLHDESVLLSRLISDLRDLSLAEAGQLKLQLRPENVHSLVRRAVDRLHLQAQAKGVSITVDEGEELPLVAADADRVLQVIGNLLSNALRHTPAGGRISVAAKVSAETAQSRASFVQVSVSDSGVGISSEILPHIFDRFYRADRSRSRATGGSGLGLAIVQQLVHAHGGRVWAESREGSGSTFHFTLPCYDSLNPVQQAPVS